MSAEPIPSIFDPIYGAERASPEAPVPARAKFVDNMDGLYLLIMRSARQPFLLRLYVALRWFLFGADLTNDHRHVLVFRNFKRLDRCFECRPGMFGTTIEVATTEEITARGHAQRPVPALPAASLVSPPWKGPQFNGVCCMAHRGIVWAWPGRAAN